MDDEPEMYIYRYLGGLGRERGVHYERIQRSVLESLKRRWEEGVLF
jgi:hypothetical protein